MCSGPLHLDLMALPEVTKARPGQVMVVDDPSRVRWIPVAPQKLDANCRNCGAPPEPVCSYCGTKA